MENNNQRLKILYLYKILTEQTDEEHGLTASFNTPRDIYLKTLWAKRNGLGGVFVWHYSCDVPADNNMSLFNQVVRAKDGRLFGQ